MLKTTGNDSIQPQIYTDLNTSSDHLVPPIRSHGGLTKREHFAAMALQGIIAGETSEHGYYDISERILDKDTGLYKTDEHGKYIVKVIRSAKSRRAENAVKQADALIEALNKELEK